MFFQLLLLQLCMVQLLFSMEHPKSEKMALDIDDAISSKRKHAPRIEKEHTRAKKKVKS